MTHLDRIREAIDGEIAFCAERVRNLVSEAVQLSEREVVAAGECVEAVKNEAREHADDLQIVSRALESHDDADSLGVAIGNQSRTLEDLMARLRAGQGVQQETIGAVVGAAARIDKFVNVIGDIATGLRVLTLNARIEAARRGAQGAAFSTIADNMRGLATDVQRANEGIGALASELSGSARRAEDTNAELQRLMEAAQRDMGAQLDHLLSAFHGAQSTSADATRIAATRAHRVVDLTNDILTHLQFQDRMAQVLGEVNKNLERTQSVTEEILALPETEDVERVADEIRTRGATATVRLSGESELSSSEREMESGVVMLF